MCVPSVQAQSSENFQMKLRTDEHHRLFADYPPVAGYHYTVEESQDLTEWQPIQGGWHYGMDNQHTI